MLRLSKCLVFVLLLSAGLISRQASVPSAQASGPETILQENGSPADNTSADSTSEDRLQNRPAKPIGQVRRDSNGDEVPDQVGDTVVVVGRVTAEPGAIPVPEEGVGALQDGTGGIHVLLPGNQTLSRGDSARVRGVLQHESGLAHIEGLESERLGGSRRAPDPIPLSVPSAAGERHEGRLARIEGTITARSENQGGEYFVFREEETADAQLTVFVSDRHAGRVPLEQFEEGDNVAVTGVVSQYDLSYQILPREAKDLAHVGQAQTYLWWALLGIGGLGIASLTAIMFLRTAVRRRTRELKRSREELREKENRLRSITENVSDGIYRSTSEEGIVYANQAFLDLFGYASLEEMREIDPSELYADPTRRKELVEQEARQGRLEGVEVRYRRKDGTTFVGLLNTHQFEKEGGEKTFHDGAITDITERKRQRKALQKRQSKIEALYSAADRLLRASSPERVAEALVGLVRDALGYRGVSVRLAREGRLEVISVAESTFEFMPERPPVNIDGKSAVAQVYRSGETLVVSDLEEAQIEDPHDHGDLRSTVVVAIGEHGTFSVASPEPGAISKFDTHLIEVLGRYAALVLGRLQREKTLRVAKEEAEEASRLKSSFLANMSHEIRTPLTSIIGFAEALGTEISEELSDKSSLKQQARLIEQGGKRLLETLEGVLNLSKLEAGQMEFAAEPLDLAERARRTAEEFRPKAEEKGIGLRAPSGDARVLAQADEGGVQIVLQNLLSNAIKYTKEEGEVRVRTHQTEKAAVLEVEDTGVGMERGRAEELFEPFRQASEGMNRKYEGSGVGLAVTRRAVEEMGGTIEVETQKGEGSRFTVRLPRPETSKEEA